MQPLKPGKDNISAISQYYDTHILRQLIVSYLDFYIISIYNPSLIKMCGYFHSEMIPCLSTTNNYLIFGAVRQHTIKNAVKKYESKRSGLVPLTDI